MAVFSLYASIINDLLPYRSGLHGKTSREITSKLRRDGYDVSLRVVTRTLENMEPIFGLQKIVDAKGRIRWKRTRPVMVAHCMRAHDFQGEALDIDWDDPCTGMHEHAMPDFRA